jgi:hypothetical protein
MFAVPFRAYVEHAGPLRVGDVASRVVAAVPGHFRVQNAHAAAYALNTPALVHGGLSYLFMPSATLFAGLGYISDRSSLFLWHAAVGTLAMLAPAATCSLKPAADAGRLGERVPRALNAGLLTAAGGHGAARAARRRRAGRADAAVDCGRVGRGGRGCRRGAFAGRK